MQMQGLSYDQFQKLLNMSLAGQNAVETLQSAREYIQCNKRPRHGLDSSQASIFSQLG